ncbi:MAG: hypothetical protein H0T94_01825 [Acidimicrobiia bacterium]|nr:hypothetical protein [Acidimicrobiia bacterium]
MHKKNWQLGLAILLMAACTAEPDATALSDTTTTTRVHASTTLAEDGVPAALAGAPEACPLTAPGRNAFTPASEAPDDPPDVYDEVWYGTPALWTMIDPEGEINSKRWLSGDKTFWWSENYSPGDPGVITVTAQHLNGSALTVEASKPAGSGFNPFMLAPTHESVTVVVVVLPESGCWELTADYKGAVISYVVWVDNN